MKKQLLSLLFAVLVCMQVKAYEGFPELTYPNSQAAEIASQIRPSVPNLILLEDEEDKPIDEMTPQLRQRMREIDTRIATAPRTSSGVLSFGRSDEEYQASLNPTASAVIIVATERESLDRLTVAKEMVIDFLNKYDQAIERLELGLVYGHQGDLRMYALSQRSLEFFQDPATIAAYDEYLVGLLKDAMDSNPTNRASELAEIQNDISQRYQGQHFPMTFIENLGAQ